MSISGISSASASAYQSSGGPSEFQQDLRALVSSLKSGDLSGAQQAYAALSKLQANGQGPPANSPFSQALNQIGESLQNNNLSGAQQALSSLQQARGGHHHGGHHGGGASTTTPASTATSSTPPTVNTTNINVVSITA